MMMLLTPFFYYFTTRVLLREDGIRKNDFWMLQVVLVYTISVLVVSINVPVEDKDSFVKLLSGIEPHQEDVTTGLLVMLALDDLGYVFYLVEQLFVLVYCFFSLNSYQKMLQTYYSDITGKSLSKLYILFSIVSIRFLLYIGVCFIPSIGQNLWFRISECVLAPAFYASVLYFIFGIHYSAEELGKLIASQNNQKQLPVADELIASRMANLIESRFYVAPEVNLMELASQVQVNTKYLADYLKYHYGETFLTFVNRLRIEYAIELMADDNLSLTDISDRTGFITPSTFYRNFSKIKNISPSEYRKNVNNRAIP